ncbi:hypothetical protein BH11PSE8_BH11PSE8_44440 [soil metagenome]
MPAITQRIMFIVRWPRLSVTASIFTRRLAMTLWLCLVVLVLPATATWAAAARPAPVSVCADPDPPPWTYRVRDREGKSTPRFTGFSVDLLAPALARTGHDVRFIGNMPWARCLSMVEHGEIDFAMDA